MAEGALTLIVFRERKPIERIRVGMFVEVRAIMDEAARKRFLQRFLDVLGHAVQQDADLRTEIEALSGEMWGFAQDANTTPRP